jgi:hypothetical protein
VTIDEDEHVPTGVSEHEALRSDVGACVVVADARDERADPEERRGLLDRADAVGAQLVVGDREDRRGRGAGALGRARCAGDDVLVEELLEVAQRRVCLWLPFGAWLDRGRCVLGVGVSGVGVLSVGARLRRPHDAAEQVPNRHEPSVAPNSTTRASLRN